ncbi:MAG: pentapeptide repeat-containing protein [Anaerolineales bacterium]|nr:pentapeptide repeat-containing protein [Anaerolineales bacterium]
MDCNKINPPHFPGQFDGKFAESLADYNEYMAVDLSGSDFSNQQARGVLFEGSRLRRVNFLGTRLEKARLVDVALDACEFSGAGWEEPHFRRVELIGSRMIGWQLFEARFEEVLFRECKFERAVFVNSTFKAARFERCDLCGVSFDKADLSGVMFADCDLTQAVFRSATLQDADFRTAVLNGMQIEARDMIGAVIHPSQAVQVVSLLGVQVQESDETLFAA